MSLPVECNYVGCDNVSFIISNSPISESLKFPHQMGELNKLLCAILQKLVPLKNIKNSSSIVLDSRYGRGMAITHEQVRNSCFSLDLKSYIFNMINYSVDNDFLLKCSFTLSPAIHKLIVKNKKYTAIFKRYFYNLTLSNLESSIVNKVIRFGVCFR